MFSSNKTLTQAKITFVMGGPGSGKGTHCERLQREQGYHHISTGDLIRNLVAESAEVNSAKMADIRSAMQRGELLSDEMITDILANEMQKYPAAKHFLIDGYPRTLGQLALFEKNIGQCDKILFFNTTVEIMKSRLLTRADVEHREDDKDTVIDHRIQVYQDKTLPVIHHLEKNKADKFVCIDTSGTVEETTTHVNKAIAANDMANVNLVEFLACYLQTGNFYDVIETLEQRYHTLNFKIAMAFTTLFCVVQNKEDVKKVLNANTVAGFQNHNFDVSHGHLLNINAVPAFVEGKINPIWQGLHAGILHSVGNAQGIYHLVAKHFHHFLAKSTFSLDIAFETFMENFWCEFMFGSKVDAAKFRQTRHKLISALKYSYYDSKLKNIPYIGTQACKLYGFIKKNEFAEIDNELREFITQADDCLFSRFRQDLLKNASFPSHQVDTALLDNAFVLILALDFIQNAMYETLRLVVKSGLNTTEARKKVYSEGLQEAFLFPFRTRVPQESIALHDVSIPSGIPVYINLLKSGLYHSAGARTCAGIGVTQWMKEAIWDQLKEVRFELVNTSYPIEREKISHSRDVPVSPERYEVNWRYARDYLQKALPHYQFKGVNEFFDVLKVYENPFLSHYVTTSFIEAIEKLHIDRSTLCIATPEVRGIPVAAAVAVALNVPLVVIRKPGKIPGAVISKKYMNAYAEENVELSATSTVANKNIIFIDDGIASGGTTIACCDLLKQQGGNVSLILAMINHTYKEKIATLQQYPVQTLFDFASHAPKVEDKLAVVIPLSSARSANSFFKPAPEINKLPQISGVSFRC